VRDRRIARIWRKAAKLLDAGLVTYVVIAASASRHNAEVPHWSRCHNVIVAVLESAVEPKFHLARHITSRHARQCRVVTGVLGSYSSMLIVNFCHFPPRKLPIWLRLPSLSTASITFFGDNRREMILTQCTSQNNKRIVYNKTFALLFASNELAPYLRLCFVRCCLHVITRVVRVAPCWTDTRDTLRHDFFVPQCTG